VVPWFLSSVCIFAYARCFNSHEHPIFINFTFLCECGLFL
jgi:hypothetical protein